MDIIIEKKPLTLKGFLKVLSLKKMFPKGLSSKVKDKYTDLEDTVQPSVIQSNPEFTRLVCLNCN